MCDPAALLKYIVFLSLILSSMQYPLFFSFFFFNDTATTEIYTLSLHDALPIFCGPSRRQAKMGSLLSLVVQAAQLSPVHATGRGSWNSAHDPCAVLDGVLEIGRAHV